jgi:hypothetical protein
MFSLKFLQSGFPEWKKVDAGNVDLPTGTQVIPGNRYKIVWQVPYRPRMDSVERQSC